MVYVRERLLILWATVTPLSKIFSSYIHLPRDLITLFCLQLNNIPFCTCTAFSLRIRQFHEHGRLGWLFSVSLDLGDFLLCFIERVFKLLARHSPRSTSVIHRLALFIVSHRSFLHHLCFLVNLSQMSLLTAKSFTLPSRPTLRSSPRSILWTGGSRSFPLADLRNKSRNLCLLSKCSSTKLNPQTPQSFSLDLMNILFLELQFPPHVSYFFIELHFHSPCPLSL